VASLCGADDRCIWADREACPRVGHQIGLELGEVNVESTVEPQGGSQRWYDLPDSGSCRSGAQCRGRGDKWLSKLLCYCLFVCLTLANVKTTQITRNVDHFSQKQPLRLVQLILIIRIYRAHWQVKSNGSKTAQY
jgi:hypothetical protein